MSTRRPPGGNTWSYRGCCVARRGRYRLDPVRRELHILLVILEARLRDESTDVGEVLSTLLDLTEVLTFAAPKIAARAAERARMLAFAGYTPALSRAARKFLKMGEVGPQHPAHVIWVELAESEDFHRSLDTAELPPEPLPEWLKS
jgi:hypothetical protein